MKGIKISDEIIDKICELYQSNWRIKDIAKELDIEDKTVRQYLKLNNIKIARIHGYIGDEIIEKYINGTTMQQLSKEYGFNIDTISKYLKENNIEIRRFKFNKEEKVQICKDYQGGLSEEKIAQKYNSNRNTISSILKEYDVKTRSQSAYRKYSINEHYFDEIDTPNKAYILGFLYADGYVSKNDNCVSIGLQSKDKHILEDIRVEIETDKPLYFDERSKKRENHQDIYTLSIFNGQIHDSLVKWGVVPNKTFLITYPDFLSQDLQRHFIRGLLDGDGTISNPSGKSRSKVSYICGTQMLCDGIKNIVEKELNIRCVVTPYSSIYIARICGSYNVGKFLSWLYEDANMYLERKYDRYIKYYKNT